MLKLLQVFFGGDASSINELGDRVVEKIGNNTTRMIVFDDLERCRVDVTELFGYFNSLIEKCGKIIIIGDEFELKKYLNSKEVSTNKLASSILIKKDEKKDKISKKELKEQIDLIAEPIYYDAIKEKTISLTYSFAFDENIIFDCLANDSRYKSIKRILNTNKDYILWILSRYNCKNFRTCILAMEYYLKIHNVVKRTKILNRKYIYRDTLLATFLYMVMEKHPHDGCDLGLYFEHNKIELGEYSSIKNNVKILELDKKGLIKDILQEDEKYTRIMGGDIPKSLINLKEAWIYQSDEELTENINQLILDLKNDNIPLEFFHLVYRYLHSYKNSYGFECDYDVDDIKKTIIEKIKKSNKYIESEDEMFLLLNVPDNQKQGVLDIYKAIKEHNQEIEKRNIEETILAPRIITYEEITKISEQSISRNAFLSIFKVADLMQYIKNCDNVATDNLRTVIKNVYNFSNIKDYYLADCETVKCLIEELEKYKPSCSHTKAKIIEWLIDLLKNIYSRLSLKL